MKNLISEIEVVPIKPKDGLVGFASFVLYESFYCGSIGINTRPGGGYRLTYPTRKNGNFNNHVFYPINKKVAGDIELAIISKFEIITPIGKI